MNNQAEKPKRLPGRPVKDSMPDQIPDTPENVIRGLLSPPPKRESDRDYIRRTGRKTKRL